MAYVTVFFHPAAAKQHYIRIGSRNGELKLLYFGSSFITAAISLSLTVSKCTLLFYPI